jgi:hypothetical protein
MARFDKEASQTRDDRVAKEATRFGTLRLLRAGSLARARPDPSQRKKRLLRDDHQTEPLPVTDDRSASVVRRAALPRGFLGNRAN